jgi:hypothetical protein
MNKKYTSWIIFDIVFISYFCATTNCYVVIIFSVDYLKLIGINNSLFDCKCCFQLFKTNQLKFLSYEQTKIHHIPTSENVKRYLCTILSCPDSLGYVSCRDLIEILLEVRFFGGIKIDNISNK